MRMVLGLVLVMLAPIASAAGAAVGSDGRGSIAVARAGMVETFDRDLRPIAMLPGVQEPSLIRVSGANIAVLDAVNGETLIIRGGNATRHQGKTPVDALWAEDAAFVLDRDARLLWRHAHDGSSSRTTARSASMIRAAGERVFVYSPMEGTIDELTHELSFVRTLPAPKFGADFEVTEKTAYLAVPSTGEVTAVALAGKGGSATWRTGAVPADILITAGAGVIRPDELAIADPSSRVVWRQNGPESVAGAFGRGFLRGFLGLRVTSRDLSVGRAVDRIASAGGVIIAYDTTRGELFRCSGREVRMIASAVGPQEWTAEGESVLVLDRGTLRRI